MTNNQGNSVGISVILMFIIFIVSMVLLSSCGSTKLTNEQRLHRAKIDKEMNTLWNDYSYKIDSLYIEYYKK